MGRVRKFPDYRRIVCNGLQERTFKAGLAWADNSSGAGSSPG